MRERKERKRDFVCTEPSRGDLECVVCVYLCCQSFRELCLPSCVNLLWPHCDCVSTPRQRQQREAEKLGEQVIMYKICVYLGGAGGK